MLGATSGIARALCHELARRGCRLVLAGRDAEELGKVASDLRIRYHSEGFVETFDAFHDSTQPKDWLEGLADLHRKDPALAAHVAVHRVQAGRETPIRFDAGRIAPGRKRARAGRGDRRGGARASARGERLSRRGRARQGGLVAELLDWDQLRRW